MISAIITAQTNTIVASSGLQIEQDRKHDASVMRSRIVVSKLAGQKLADAIDLADPIHGFAGRIALEIIERQPQQAVEEMQSELGVEPRADHRDDQPSRIAEQRLIGKDDRHNHRQQHQRRHAVELQHLVDGRHDQKRRENRQHADGKRREADVAQRLAFLQHQSDQASAD